VLPLQGKGERLVRVSDLGCAGRRRNVATESCRRAAHHLVCCKPLLPVGSDLDHLCKEAFQTVPAISNAKQTDDWISEEWVSSVILAHDLFAVSLSLSLSVSLVPNFGGSWSLCLTQFSAAERAMTVLHASRLERGYTPYSLFLKPVLHRKSIDACVWEARVRLDQVAFSRSFSRLSRQTSCWHAPMSRGYPPNRVE